MEKPTSSRELECVGRLEVVRPKPVGFLCGSIPVPTDKSFHVFNSDLVPSSQTVSAPRYRMLPTETDLNMPPLVPDLPEKALPVDYPSVQCRTSSGDVPWDGGAITPNLTRKGEALAVSGLANYGDELDVIAPADILKQIFKMPYSRARLSIAVHRVGQTLILNAGPDVDEDERVLRRGQPKSADQSLFSNFAMHSVRVEACDCPPSHSAAAEAQSQSSVLSDFSVSIAKTFDSSHIQRTRANQEKTDNDDSEYSIPKHDKFYWGSKKNMRNKGRDHIKQATCIGEKSRSSVQESEIYRRAENDEFLRVLFWQFHNFRMLLGSDLLIFSNDKYVAVSLHLWDVSRQVTPLTWLEAWLDNVMASIPELAICYHQNGVVQGYELLKTDDIFLLKGIAEDGTPAFHPHVVQQNGLSVLRFLQENCKRDPGAYWLYKNAGDDAIQLFDLSVIPQKHQSERNDDCSSSLPSLVHQRRTNSLLSLGMLLYRIAHRLSLSLVTSNRARCARFIRKCLELLDEPDHLVVRAFAHEQFARLILNNNGEELDLYPFESEVKVTDAKEESLDIVHSIAETSALNILLDEDENICTESNKIQDAACRASERDTSEKTSSKCGSLIAAGGIASNSRTELMYNVNSDGNLTVCNIPPQPIDDPISSKLAAVHHVSQAIKSLGWKREFQVTEPDLVYQESNTVNRVPMDYPVCACGDPDCIEVCDIKQWLPTSKLDRKLWKLVLLLGESYLALGQAYKEDSQLNRALKVVEVACSVYGSVPQYLDDSRFISSMVGAPSSKPILDVRHQKKESLYKKLRLKNGSSDDCVTFEDFSLTYLFWAKAWALVGDVHAEVYKIKGEENSSQYTHEPPGKEVRMSSSVVEELIRLKKKLGKDRESCSLCSLINCSCQSDRASSGSNASSSHGSSRQPTHGRRQTKRSHGRNAATSLNEKPKSVNSNHQGDTTTDSRLVEQRCSSKPDVASALSEDDEGSKEDNEPKTSKEESPKAKSGGIFRYLQLSVSSDGDNLLLSALNCYQEARQALHGVPAESIELNSVLKKIGWVSNELGRTWLDRKDLGKAELAFADAIEAFKEVSDHINIILINCNLGHGRRALAEELLSQINYFKTNPIFFTTYKQALETAKIEYGRALRFYGAAKSELAAILKETDEMSVDLRNEVCTQFAHTYLKLGMLLASEDTVAEVYENVSLDERKLPFHGSTDKRTKEYKKNQISANDAIREALSTYESLGELRRQEAAYAYFQLACYQRDCCSRFLDPNYRSNNGSKSENTLQRAKQYASLAERNWQRAIEFYCVKTHPHMYLTILTERAAVKIALSGAFHSNAMLETALSCLLEGRHASLKEDKQDISEVQSKFWAQLQVLLKKMLALTRTPGSSKTVSSSPQSTLSLKRLGDADKLRELYKMSLKSSDLSQLQDMHTLWTSTPRSS